MPSLQDQVVAGVVVLLVIVGVMVYNMLAGGRKRPAPVAPGTPEPWVGKHVQHEGDIVGKVVAMDGDALIVQKGTKYLGVPRSRIRPQGLDLALTGTFDEEAFTAAGKIWSEAHTTSQGIQ